MKIYIAVMCDRHVDNEYSVHRTQEGANHAIDEFLTSYEGQYQWQEEDWGQPERVRYVRADIDDGPHAYIQVSELND